MEYSKWKFGKIINVCSRSFHLINFKNYPTFQGGKFQLQLKSTGKCLTAEGEGTYLDQWDCVGDSAPHQSWTLDIIDDSGPAAPPVSGNFKGRLRNYAFDTKCLHATSGDNGAELEIVDCSNSNKDLLVRADSFYVKFSFSMQIQIYFSLSISGHAKRCCLYTI